MPSIESLTDLGVHEAAARIRRGEVSLGGADRGLPGGGSRSWSRRAGLGAPRSRRRAGPPARRARRRGARRPAIAGRCTACRSASRTSSTWPACRPTAGGARVSPTRGPRTTAGRVGGGLRAAGAVDRPARTHTTQFAFRDPAPHAQSLGSRAQRRAARRSGSAAAVAARMVPCAIGSQTGGLHPAAGGVLRCRGPQGARTALVRSTARCRWRGSLDHIGPFARSVADAAARAGPSWPTPSWSR